MLTLVYKHFFFLEHVCVCMHIHIHMHANALKSRSLQIA